jgi:hypothetical protein
MFLLKYTSTNMQGYYLVYAKTIEEAKLKLEEHLFFIDGLHIENATI